MWTPACPEISVIKGKQNFRKCTRDKVSTWEICVQIKTEGNEAGPVTVPWEHGHPVPSSVIFFLRFIYYYMQVHCSCLQTLQKRESDLIIDDCEPPCGCWELNSWSLKRAASALNRWAISPAPQITAFRVNCLPTLPESWRVDSGWQDCWPLPTFFSFKDLFHVA